MKRVAKVLTKPKDGDYVPSAASVARKLQLPYSRQSIRNAVKEAGFNFSTKKKRTFLSTQHRAQRVTWAKQMLKRGHDFHRTLCSDEKMFVLEDVQKRCWMTDNNPRFRNVRQFPKHVMVWSGMSLVGNTEK